MLTDLTESVTITDGYTEAPDNTEVQNLQVLDIVEANSPSEAFQSSENWLELKKHGFEKEDVICYELGERVVIEK